MKNNFEIRGDVTTIFLKYKEETIETLIDTADFEIANKFPNTWYAMWSKKTKSFYCIGDLMRKRKRTTYLLHRLIAKTPIDKVTDHINHQTTDNRKTNLRNITVAENNQNRDSSKLRKEPHLYWNEQMQKWIVYVSRHSKTKNLGSYKDIDEARKVLIEFKKKYVPYSQEALDNAK